MLKAHSYIGFRKSHSFRVSLPFQLTESTVKIHITNHTIWKINYLYTYYIAPTFQGEKNSLFFQVRYPMFDLSYCNIYITMLSTYKAKKNEVLKKSIQTLFNSLLPFSRSVLNHITFVDIAPYFKKKFNFFFNNNSMERKQNENNL